MHDFGVCLYFCENLIKYVLLNVLQQITLFIFSTVCLYLSIIKVYLFVIVSVE